jgi:hypothetical protein
MSQKSISNLCSLCQTHNFDNTTNCCAGKKVEKLLDALLAGQQNMQKDLCRLSDRLDSLEQRATFSTDVHAAENARPSRDGHPKGLESDTQSKPSPGALLRRLKRGDLRVEDEKEGNGGSMAAAIARDGVWATLLGIRKADQRKGIEGSRLIHPRSPFFKGAPVYLHIAF